MVIKKGMYPLGIGSCRCRALIVVSVVLVCWFAGLLVCWFADLEVDGLPFRSFFCCLVFCILYPASCILYPVMIWMLDMHMDMHT